VSYSIKKGFFCPLRLIVFSIAFKISFFYCNEVMLILVRVKKIIEIKHTSLLLFSSKASIHMSITSHQQPVL